MKIKVMAEYSSSGLWDIEAGGELNPDRVNASDGLKKLLKDWIATYSQIIDWENPTREKVLTKEFKAKLNALEDKVFEEVKRELGKDHELVFRSHKLPL